jgi:hypothetical protein
LLVLGLIPQLGYFGQCCSEHGCAGISCMLVCLNSRVKKQNKQKKIFLSKILLPEPYPYLASKWSCYPFTGNYTSFRYVCIFFLRPRLIENAEVLSSAPAFLWSSNIGLWFLPAWEGVFFSSPRVSDGQGVLEHSASHPSTEINPASSHTI